MVTVFVRHDVADYDVWRKGYDAAEAMQKGGGVLAEAVYQSADDPNDITVTHDFATLEDARAFLSRADLKEAMETIGVVGAPTVWFANKV